jgi:hypothetical protein
VRRHPRCTVHSRERDTAPAEPDMLDLTLLAATVSFFLISLAYVRGCDRL